MIDQYQIQRIDLLKIDVERAELDVLRGIEQRHWSVVRHLVVEVQGETRLAEVKQLVQSHCKIIAIEPDPACRDMYLLYAAGCAGREC